LEQLAKMESKLKESGDAAEAEKKGGRGQAEEGEQDDDDAVLEEYEEEDDFIEDDDYYQVTPSPPPSGFSPRMHLLWMYALSHRGTEIVVGDAAVLSDDDDITQGNHFDDDEGYDDPYDDGDDGPIF
jgi:hypothetical protein